MRRPLVIVLALATPAVASATDALTFRRHHESTRPLEGTHFAPADVDLDGDLDLLGAMTTSDTVSWLENLGGTAFGDPLPVATLVAPAFVAGADLDGDGDDDVLASSNDRIVWYANLGGGLFGPEQAVSTTISFLTQPVAADLDGDGDLDIACGEILFDDLFAWRNLGGGVFAAAGTVDPAAFSTDLVAADIDADGDLDLVSGHPNELRWYENAGAGGLVPQAPLYAADALSIAGGDLDDDGDVDFVVGSQSELTPLWNDGTGIFVPSAPISAVYGGYEPELADLDGDGDLDIVANPTAGMTLVAIFENLGGTFGPMRIIADDALSWDPPGAADLDSDGDADVFMDAGTRNVRFYESVVGTQYGDEDHAGANLVLADGDQLSGTLTNVGLFHVPAGVRVTVAPGVPAVVEAVTILVEGELDASEAGHPASGGFGGIDDDGVGVGGGRGSQAAGPGGGGYGGHGGTGGSACGAAGGAGGDLYGEAQDPIAAELGSSGGAGGGLHVGEGVPGGAGGGSITLRANTVTIAATGSVSADGDDGSTADWPGALSGGGGGSGGSIVLDATLSTVDGLLSATGGDGGAGDSGLYCAPGAGGGAGGRITVAGAFAGVLDADAVSGGRGAASGTPGDRGGRGEAGTVYVSAWVAGPPVLAITNTATTTTVDVVGASAIGQIVLLSGTGVGATGFDPGGCPGLVTGLTGLRERRFENADALGVWTTSFPYLAARSGTPLQVVDVNSCTVSAVQSIP